jgi:hypothetical protein
MNHLGALYTRERLLAMAIPALSFAAGGDIITTLGDKNYNLDSDTTNGMKNGWPRNKSNSKYETRWLHTDMKDVAYLYTHKLFKKIVEIGQLQ